MAKEPISHKKARKSAKFSVTALVLSFGYQQSRLSCFDAIKTKNGSNTGILQADGGVMCGKAPNGAALAVCV